MKENQQLKAVEPCFMWLLFQEKPEVPDQSVWQNLLKERGYCTELGIEAEGFKTVLLPEYIVEFKEGKKACAQLVLFDVDSMQMGRVDSFARQQFWDVPDGVNLMESCGYRVLTGDFLSLGLSGLQRCAILSDWLEIVLEMFPDCVAVYFQASQKLLTANQLRHNPLQGSTRFLYGGLNARLFNVEKSSNKKECVVDTLGLYAFGVADVQYHFFDLDVNEVVNHAYRVALYQFEQGMPIQNQETVEGFGEDQRWSCCYEVSLVQPMREVLDIQCKGNAAGRDK